MRRTVVLVSPLPKELEVDLEMSLRVANMLANALSAFGLLTLVFQMHELLKTINNRRK